MLAPSLIYFNNDQGLEAPYQSSYCNRDNSALIPWWKWKDLQTGFQVLRVSRWMKQTPSFKKKTKQKQNKIKHQTNRPGQKTAPFPAML